MKLKHFPHHTKARAAELNACGRYILASVLRSDYESSLGGITAKGNPRSTFILIPCFEGNFSLTDLQSGEKAVILEVMPPAFEGCPFRFKERGDNRQLMASGNYITGDSRFSDTYGAPVSVHDRCEG